MTEKPSDFRKKKTALLKICCWSWAAEGQV